MRVFQFTCQKTRSILNLVKKHNFLRTVFSWLSRTWLNTYDAYLHLYCTQSTSNTYICLKSQMSISLHPTVQDIKKFKPRIRGSSLKNHKKLVETCSESLAGKIKYFIQHFRLPKWNTIWCHSEHPKKKAN